MYSLPLVGEGELIFVGFGLGDLGLTVKGLEIVKNADKIYVETYTNYTPDWVVERLEELSGRRFERVSRKELEESGGATLLETASDSRVVFLVPGDPFMATTHIALRLEAEKKGIKTWVVNSSSIVAAAAGACGLQIYKFGESATVVFPEGDTVSMKPYDTVLKNLERGLHTLLLLDYRAEEGRAMTVNYALKLLRDVEKIRRMGVFNDDRLVVGLARLGYDNYKVKGGPLKDVLNEDFGEPPHCIVIPGSLHFMEAEALKILADVKETFSKREGDARSYVPLDRLNRYISGVEKVFRDIRLLESSRLVDRGDVAKALDWARNYYEDSRAFRDRGDLVSSLVAVAYCEGILEGLRLLNLVDFKWEGEV